MCHAICYIRLHISKLNETKTQPGRLAWLRAKPRERERKKHFHNLLAFFIFATSFFRSVCVSFINMRPGDFPCFRLFTHSAALIWRLCLWVYACAHSTHFYYFVSVTLFLRNKFSWWCVYLNFWLHCMAPSDAHGMYIMILARSFGS